MLASEAGARCIFVAENTEKTAEATARCIFVIENEQPVEAASRCIFVVENDQKTASRCIFVADNKPVEATSRCIFVVENQSAATSRCIFVADNKPVEAKSRCIFVIESDKRCIFVIEKAAAKRCIFVIKAEEAGGKRCIFVIESEKTEADSRCIFVVENEAEKASRCIFVVENDKADAGKVAMYHDRLTAWDLTRVKQHIVAKGIFGADEVDAGEREYKRFLALGCAMQANAVPVSGRVDEFWHAHILFTEDYAAMCQAVLGKFMHHRPEAADAPEPTEAELAPYIACFGAPDPAWWGGAARTVH